MTVDVDFALNHVPALQALVTGAVRTPDDPAYAESTKLFNAMIHHRPPLVVDCADADDVAAAIRYAREQGLDLSVRGGGHGVLGQATAGQLVLNLAAINSVSVDPVARTATVGGGAVWGPVDAATQEYGLAVPGGRVSHTGVAGLTLGGGQGWLSSKYGLTVDSLREVKLVTAEGRAVTASATSEPDLFWALRGGGGGFGAVTEFTFDLHPVGPMILGGMLLFPAERAVEICAFYSDFVAGAPADFGGGAVFLSAPPAPFVPPEAVGAPLLSVLISWFGDHEAGERFIAPLRALQPMVDLVAPLPYVALQQMIDQGNPFGRRQYWTAHYMDRLSPQLLDDVVELAANRPSVFSDVILAPMGVAAQQADPEATAFGHREAGWLFHPIAQWEAADDDAANIGWAKAIKAAAAPYAIAGTYLNVDGTGTAERSRFAYGEATFARLSAIKAQWDPDNVFRHAIPVSGN